MKNTRDPSVDTRVNRHTGKVAQLRLSQPSVLLVAAKWWPLSARLASALLHHGCRVAAVCPLAHPLIHVAGINRIHRYAGVLSLASLQRAMHEGSPDVVVPCDDGVVAQLHAIHRLDPSLRGLIERSLGPSSSYPIVRSRHRFLMLAEELGLRVACTRRVTKADDLVAWHASVPESGVLKVDGESGGNGVIMCHSLDESIAAWHQLSVPSGYAAACKRLLIDRNPLSVWQRRVATPPEITIQEFICGRPANSMVLCQRGEVLAVVSVIVVAAESAVGAATVVRVIDDPRMTLAAERLAQRLHLSGFFGLDFMVDQSGEPFLIELNPRCTQLGHFELPDRASLAAGFAASLRGELPSSPQRPIWRRTIALFPQALAAGDLCTPYIAASHHDVPHDEPALVRELGLPSWPQRQWQSRLYHRFSPLQRGRPVVFEAPEATDMGIEGHIATAMRAATRSSVIR